MKKRKKEKQEEPKEPVKVILPPTDCSSCLHHEVWKFGLFYCKHRIIPAPSCIVDNTHCINYVNNIKTKNENEYNYNGHSPRHG